MFIFTAFIADVLQHSGMIGMNLIMFKAINVYFLDAVADFNNILS